MSRGSSPAPQLLSWGSHRTWSWRKPIDYGFARSLRSVPISLHEAADAASCFPLVVVSDAEALALHALLRARADGYSPFVGPQGQWQAAWMPHRIAAWPFDLRRAGDGRMALAIHADEHHISSGPGALPIFSDSADRTLSVEAARAVAPLHMQADALPATARAVCALDDAGLLKPLEDDPTVSIIDATGLSDMSEDMAMSLHRAKALGLAYAACVSLSHLSWMRRAEAVLSKAVRRPSAQGDTPSGRASSFLDAIASAQFSEQAFSLSSGAPET